MRGRTSSSARLVAQGPAGDGRRQARAGRPRWRQALRPRARRRSSSSASASCAWSSGDTGWKTCSQTRRWRPLAETAAPQTGNIYDLGYRGYDGERLGRRYAVTSLYIYSLRAIFGLGRSAWAKVFPFGLAIIALIPATIQLGIAAIAPVRSDFDQAGELLHLRPGRRRPVLRRGGAGDHRPRPAQPHAAAVLLARRSRASTTSRPSWAPWSRRCSSSWHCPRSSSSLGSAVATDDVLDAPGRSTSTSCRRSLAAPSWSQSSWAAFRWRSPR